MVTKVEWVTVKVSYHHKGALPGGHNEYQKAWPLSPQNLVEVEGRAPRPVSTS